MLIVDDNKALCKFFRELGKLHGWETTEAHTTQEASEIIKQFDFDLIVLNIILGNENGYMFLTKLKNDGVKFPIMVWSGISEPGSDSLALALGAKAFVDKVASMKELLDTVKKLLGGDDHAE